MLDQIPKQHPKNKISKIIKQTNSRLDQHNLIKRTKSPVTSLHLQIENNYSFSTQDSGRIGQQRIKKPKISGINLNSFHNDILIHIQNRTPSFTVQRNPASGNRSSLLLRRSLLLLLLHRTNLRFHRDYKPITTHL